MKSVVPFGLQQQQAETRGFSLWKKAMEFAIKFRLLRKTFSDFELQ
jgi:hypothetical protein